MPRPSLPKPGFVLGLVEAWPSSQTHCGEVRATASLDQPAGTEVWLKVWASVKNSLPSHGSK